MTVVWPVTIRNIRILRCEVLFEPRSEFPQHEFYGSMWRGALGHGLAKMGGVARRDWLPRVHGDDNDDVRPFRVVSTHPFEVVGPGPLVRVAYELFGSATEAEPLFQRAWSVAARRCGLGPQRVLARVVAHRVVFDERLLPADSASSPNRIVLTTPCAIKDKGRVVRPNPDLVARSALHRAAMLGDLFGQPSDDPVEVEGWDRSPPVRAFLKQVKHDRRSMRAGMASLIGWQGALELRESPCSPMQMGLRCASALGVGKNTSFGCGRVELV